ncbi:Chemotaxis protein methyltransferase CheR [Minicystis rosea]|nr:Chemotaxis protein methyltransferase CheR [Minicystis rosea]
MSTGGRRGDERPDARTEIDAGSGRPSDGNSQAMWTTSPDGRIVEDSPSWRAFTGQSHEQMKGNGWLDALHPDDRARAAEVWRVAVASRSQYEVEYRVRRHDGVYRDTVARGMPVLDDSGTVVKWVGLNVDITDQKRAARESETYRALVELSPDGIFIHSEGRVVFANETLAAMLGRPLSSLIGLSHFSLFAPSCHALIRERIAMIAKSGSVPRVVEKMVRADGSQIDVEVAARMMRYEGSDAVIVVARDVSEQKRLEAQQAEALCALAENRARLEAIVEHAPAVIYLKDLEGRMQLVNRAYEQVCGIPREHVLGRTDEEIFPEPFASRVRESDRRVIQGGQRVDVEEISGFEGAEARPYSTIKFPIFDASMQMLGTGGISIDMTEHQNLLKIAEQANRAKDEFLASVSHELRTPLNAILGWARLLRGGALSPAKQARAIETIERNAVTQTRLIEDVFDISRIITGKLRLSVAPVDLTRLVDSALEAVQTAADAKGVALSAALGARAVVVGDEDRLLQLVFNLLTNAIKFTAQGGRVEVRVAHEGPCAQIVVADTGRGIRPDFLPHVFERFRQADSSTTRVHGGLGLGLAIVKHIVELHGGTVRAASEGEGRGATFTVTIPTAPHAPPPPDAASPPAPPTPVRPPLDGLRVLVVDDEEDTRILLRSVLDECRADVTTVGAAAEALDMLRHARFDVLVSDIGMPGVDGYALIREIQRLPAAEGGRIPALALTAYSREEDRTKALRAGFTSYASKPIEPVQLQALVARLAGRIGKLGAPW